MSRAFQHPGLSPAGAADEYTNTHSKGQNWLTRSLFALVSGYHHWLRHICLSRVPTLRTRLHPKCPPPCASCLRCLLLQPPFARWRCPNPASTITIGTIFLHRLLLRRSQTVEREKKKKSMKKPPETLPLFSIPSHQLSRAQLFCFLCFHVLFDYNCFLLSALFCSFLLLTFYRLDRFHYGNERSQHSLYNNSRLDGLDWQRRPAHTGSHDTPLLTTTTLTIHFPSTQSNDTHH